MRFSNAQLAACSRLFSSAVVKELAQRGNSPLFSRLARETGVHETGTALPTVASVFDAVFTMLKSSGSRDEYIYKAALTQRILLGRHSLRTASMLTEFRAGPCKADLVILNGTSTAYEIKSERDSLARLGRQLAAYAKVFAKVYVIAAERFVADVMAEANESVGVLVLSPRLQVQTVREAADGASQICTLTLFESLRTDEAGAVLAKLGIDVPRVPNTVLRSAMRELFGSLPAIDVHTAFVQVVKEMRCLAPLQDLVNALPTSLSAAALSTPLRPPERRLLVAAVAMPMSIAIEWA